MSRAATFWVGLALATAACNDFYDVPEDDAAVDAPPKVIDASALVDGPRPIDAAQPTDCGVGPDTPGLVQQVAAESESATMLSVPLCRPSSSGDFVILVGAANAGDLMMVSGGGVDGWQRAAKHNVTANIEIWYGTSSGGSDPVTIATGSASPMWMSVSEFAGSYAAPADDDERGQQGSGEHPTAGGLDTDRLSELAIFGVTVEDDTALPTPTDQAWSALAQPQLAHPRFTQGEWYYFTSPGQSIDPQLPNPEYVDWDAAIVGFPVLPGS